MERERETARERERERERERGREAPLAALRQSCSICGQFRKSRCSNYILTAHKRKFRFHQLINHSRVQDQYVQLLTKSLQSCCSATELLQILPFL